MIQANYDWQLMDDALPDDFLKLTKKMKLSALTGKILYQRGLTEKEEIEAFLTPDLSQLHDPFLLHDMEKAVARILSAIENQEQILIYGDYDADGMTSASIMKSALDELGADELTRVYLPNRFTDGYGPNLDVYKYFVEKENVQLIITVDNGVAGIEPIAWAQSQGVDVVVTDHHSLAAELPNAYAIIHPRYPKGNYPFDDLCGAGVAFKVACALLESIPVEMIDLAAIGTVADMVALSDENRVLVAEGLKQLKNTDRTGLLALMELAGVDLSQLTEETIGFQIAPRLNSLGRLDDPNPAIELLTGWDEDEAAAIAADIEEKNTERRALADKVFKEAELQLTADDVQVIYQTGWHKGVLGLAAGRLVEKTHRPVILFAEENGILVGSARSIEGFNIFDALNSARELFIAVGGHAQAAGMTLPLENVKKLKATLADSFVAQGVDLSVKPRLQLTESLQLTDITMDTIKSLEKLRPFGMANPKPSFLIEDYQVEQARTMGADKSHLKLKLQQDKAMIEAVYFGHGAEAHEFEQSDTQLAVSLATNTWNGATNVQLMVEDARVNGIELLDVRSQEMALPAGASRFQQNQLENGIMEDVLVLVDAPTNEAAELALSAALQANNYQLIIFKNQIQDSIYLAGGGSRAQFAALYKTIFQYPEFDVRYKLKNLSDFLQIPENLLIKMIQIFEELGFVTIADGLMKVVKDAEKRDISDSQIYQELQESVKRQAFYALTDVKEIYKKLKESN